MLQEYTTQEGSTKSAIWMLDPIAMPRARSILLRIATITAVMCSTALPAMGSRMSDTKPVVSPELLLISSIEPVMFLLKGWRLGVGAHEGL